ncbi:spondin domain-containing protein [Niabella drilacis]|uniref:Spondin_N n=1 Tax=Niabella drilacis (strain DSM 25811 / CCM 8410 / CCUG 62505 / LMG 26954 / E90) TaxID=1285928 RepID=A0A1G6I779_NIADE|nr:spondin domain-containing protein [Niabella drilacis]SDC02399.1 hypothetical protein SAMN04487894_101122 [Niabella drilacis]
MKPEKKLNMAGLLILLMAFAAGAGSCSRGNSGMQEIHNITIENVLESKPLVQSGTFKGAGDPPVLFPGQSVSITFSATKGQAFSFATMYGWSNDLFFAPENPGIRLYNDDGTPAEGDVSSQIKLWDNGTRINQKPGAAVTHPGIAEAIPQNLMAINGTDAQGNTYLPASQLVSARLSYQGNSMFTLTLKNTSGGTMNETPLSPGVWAISYIANGNPLSPAPIYAKDKPTANGLTNIAEAGDIQPMSSYLAEMTGIFTPLSPVLLVVYTGSKNPIYRTGEKDRGEGLKDLAQKGDAAILAAALQKKPGVKAVYILKEPAAGVLLPRTATAAGGKVTQQLLLGNGDRIAIATMYGFSNDWFFATKDDLSTDVLRNGDISASTGLYDDGTAIDQFPGAGVNQAAFGGTPVAESSPIHAVPSVTPFTRLPDVTKIIKITLD